MVRSCGRIFSGRFGIAFSGRNRSVVGTSTIDQSRVGDTSADVKKDIQNIILKENSQCSHLFVSNGATVGTDSGTVEFDVSSVGEGTKE